MELLSLELIIYQGQGPFFCSQCMIFMFSFLLVSLCNEHGMPFLMIQVVILYCSPI